MKGFKKWKQIFIAVMAMLFMVVVAGETVEAKTISVKITEDTQEAYIGDVVEKSGSGFKINSKKLSKSKKKVKSTKLGYSEPYSPTYYTGKYFKDSEAYKEGSSSDSVCRYVETYTYAFEFLKKGTYKISQVAYWNDYYEMYDTDEWDSATGSWIYVLRERTYNAEDECWEYVQKDKDTYRYVSSYDDENKTGRGYYKGVKNGKMYASGYDGLCPVEIKTGADGNSYLYYDPVTLKVTTVTPYKVYDVSGKISSIQLGKSKMSYSNKYGKYGTYASSTSRKQMLSGTKGKLTVKMKKRYGLVDLVVKTYDKTGKAQYKLVKNKSTVTYGTNSYVDTYTSTYSSSKYTSFYKPTTVYIFYKDKDASKKSGGGYYDVKSIRKDATTGNYLFTYTYVGYNGKKTEYVDTTGFPDSYVSHTFYKK